MTEAVLFRRRRHGHFDEGAGGVLMKEAVAFRRQRWWCECELFSSDSCGRRNNCEASSNKRYEVLYLRVYMVCEARQSNTMKYKYICTLQIYVYVYNELHVHGFSSYALSFLLLRKWEGVVVTHMSQNMCMFKSNVRKTGKAKSHMRYYICRRL